MQCGGREFESRTVHMSVYEIFIAKVDVWINGALSAMPNFIAALLIFLIFYILARVAQRGVRSFAYGSSKSKPIRHLLGNLTFIIVIVAGLLLALEALSLSKAVTSLLAGAGIVGLALGFAFQDIASNFIAGLTLIIQKPFKAGDLIETNEFFGRVSDLDLRTTTLLTPQGQEVMIPNKMVFESPLKNFNSQTFRRIDLSCGVSYADDLDKARKLAIKAVSGLELIAADRPVELFYNEFADSSINFVIRFWVPFDAQKDYLGAQSMAIEAIKKAFDEEGISIPFPTRTVEITKS